MIGALEATPTICLHQHDCIASLVGKASSESEGAGWGGVVPRIVLVVGFVVPGFSGFWLRPPRGCQRPSCPAHR